MGEEVVSDMLSDEGSHGQQLELIIVAGQFLYHLLAEFLKVGSCQFNSRSSDLLTLILFEAGKGLQQLGELLNVLATVKHDCVHVDELHVEVHQLVHVVGNFLGHTPLHLHGGV